MRAPTNLEHMRRSNNIVEDFNNAAVASDAVRTCTELREQIHNDLRLQHPEWVEPSGESPMCDFYEARLLELLGAYA